MRLVSYVHKTEASPNALTKWTVKKQYSHAVIYTWATCRTHAACIYTEWALIVPVLGLKFWRNFCFGLKQNAFLTCGFITWNHFRSAKQINFLCSRLFVAMLPTSIAKIVQKRKILKLFNIFHLSSYIFGLQVQTFCPQSMPKWNIISSTDKL